MAKRRSKGEGGITRRHDHPTCPPLVNGVRPEHSCQGRYMAHLVVPRGDGTSKRKYIYGRTLKGVQTALRKALQQRDAGTLVLDTTTVEGWLNHWLEHIAAPHLKPQTLRGYTGDVKNHLVPMLGARRLTELRPEHVRQMDAALAAKGLSPTTVRKIHVTLSKALADAVHDQKIMSNPVGRTRTPTAPKNHRKGLELDQALRLLRSTDDARWWLAVFYGMRQGECLGLRWGDVDLDEKVIRIEQTLQATLGGGFVFGPPKSKAGQRVLPILPLLEARLRLARVEAGDPADDALVFVDANGEHRKPWDDYDEWHALLASLGLPKIALHAARNTAASVMEAAHIPDRLIAQILGHAQVQTTHGYQAAEVARMRAELDRAASLLLGEPPSGSATTHARELGASDGSA